MHNLQECYRRRAERTVIFIQHSSPAFQSSFAQRGSDYHFNFLNAFVVLFPRMDERRGILRMCVCGEMLDALAARKALCECVFVRKISFQKCLLSYFRTPKFYIAAILNTAELSLVGLLSQVSAISYFSERKLVGYIDDILIRRGEDNCMQVFRV